MMTSNKSFRRLPWRGRLAMILIVLPLLIFSASTQSSDEVQPALQSGAAATDNRATPSAGDDPVYAVVYQVRDLVNPIRRNSGEVTRADFMALMDRIKQHAARGTWGPVGHMEPLAQQLSLVVSHKAAGHKAVMNYLGELRAGDQGEAEAPVEEAPVYTVVYAVHDLVGPKRDLDALVDCIKQHAAPGTWGPVGGISVFPQNLSLVISHNAFGHDCVKACCAALRESAAKGTE